ncbi:MAG: cytochrome-c peroxidase [Gammaproteobacteria bacterium]
MKTKKIIAYAAFMWVIASVPGVAQGLTQKEELGKSIFFDPNLSINNNQSCSTCHAPESGWTGPNRLINAAGSVYQGSIPGEFGNRKPPSSAYATQSPILHVDKKGLFVGGNFWDGRATGETLGNPAAEQAKGPFLNPKEQALPSAAEVVNRVCNNTDYGNLFTEVWGAGVCNEPVNVEEAYDDIAYSIAAYEASPESNAFTSKFDLSRKGKAQLTQQERRGFALFQGEGKCAKCHISTGQKPLFTDYTFDNLGIPKNPENPVYSYNPTFIDQGLEGFLATRPDYAGFAEENYGKQKVPTLRNVDKWDSTLLGVKEKAYGHNGYFKSLKGTVHFYNTRDVLDTCPGDYTESEALAANCWPVPEVATNVNTTELGNLGLTAEEEDAIVAFLKTLTDGYTP